MTANASPLVEPVSSFLTGCCDLTMQKLSGSKRRSCASIGWETFVVDPHEIIIKHIRGSRRFFNIFNDLCSCLLIRFICRLFFDSYICILLLDFIVKLFSKRVNFFLSFFRRLKILLQLLKGFVVSLFITNIKTREKDNSKENSRNN